MTAAFAASALAGPIDVTPSRGSFNPTLHQTVEFKVASDVAGTLTFRVLDRDGYPVRTLADSRQIDRGSLTFTWDGRDDAGRVVPDEAWSVRAQVRTSAGVEDYFPAAESAKGFGVQSKMYDPSSGVLQYILETPSRVHVQAGTIDRSSKNPAAGAVLKTIVNREPRVAGSIIDHWNGFDESGSIYVADLPDFVVAIAATPLPRGSVITTGNRSRTFLSSVDERASSSLLPAHTAHAHHSGLGSLSDVSPSLILKPLNASATQGKVASFTSDARSLVLHVEPSGRTAERFVRQPASVQVYVDGRLALQLDARGSSMRIEIPIDRLTAGRHVVAVNWGSAHGPLAANAFLLNR